MKKQLFITMVCFAFSNVLLNAAAPTDNPYKTFYGTTNAHWTDDNINWTNTFDITTTDAVSSTTVSDAKFPDATGTVWLVDSTKFAAQLSAISLAHTSAVVYFPTGKYVFGFDVYVPTNIVLRGDNPPVGKTVATKCNFSPPTIFIFPKYIHVESGLGTSKKSAFKHIHAVGGNKRSGLIYLTINRAVINYLAPKADWVNVIAPADEAPYKGTFLMWNAGQNKWDPCYQPKTIMTDVILFGLRVLNAAEPEGGVPATGQNAWQRFPNRKSAAISAFIYKNGVISNNRIGDMEACANFGDGDPTNGDYYHTENPYGLQEASAVYTNTTYPVASDNFVMSAYRLKGTGAAGTGVDKGAFTFDYNARYGININRGKLYFDPVAWQTTWYGSISHHTPADEPSSFGTNMEINDNWIFKTNRVGMQVGGLGVSVRRNVIRDQMEKSTTLDMKIDPSGTVAAAGHHTFENRGIDGSGWDVYVEDNWFEAYRFKIGGYYSTDGEGVLHQESSGSTLNGYYVRRNVGYNYLGLYKSKNIYNAEVSNNWLRNGIQTDGYIMFQADANGGPFSIYGGKVNDNNATGLKILGSVNGSDVFCNNNRVTSLALSCYVQQSNNVNAVGQVWGAGGGTITWTTGNGAAAGAPCLPTTPAIPSVAMTPNSNVYLSTIPASPVTLSWKASQTGVTDYSTWTYKLFINSVIVTGNFNADGTASYNWTVPEVNAFNIRVEANNGLVAAVSPTITYDIKYITTGIEKAVVTPQVMEFKLYPNPASSTINYVVSDVFVGGEVKIFNSMGVMVYQNKVQSGTANLNIAALSNGIYFVAINKNDKRVVKTIVKE